MTASRVQLALNVTDLESATRFYTKLFGLEPHKQRPGYANFAIADPPLKLVLIEDPAAPAALNHLGVELAGADDVEAVASRLNDLGLTTRSSQQERCCHAVQDKVYVRAPDVPLDQWELYTVLDDDPDPSAPGSAATCCPTGPGGDGPCCADAGRPPLTRCSL